MTPLAWLGAMILTALTLAVAVFRKYYMPSTDRLSEIELDYTNPRETPVKPPQQSVQPQPVPDSTPSHTQADNALETFCLAIRDFEGGPHDLNYKNNNPGNCRCSSVGYLPKYGTVVCVGGFARFETYALGWDYLKNLVHHRVSLHPTWTFLDFFNNYAPSSDNNNPHNYAAAVAKRCSRPVDSRIADFLR